MNIKSTFPVKPALLVFLVTLPWLNPFSSGPSPSQWQWIVAMMCGVLLWHQQRALTFEMVARGWMCAAVLSAVIGLIQYFGLSSPTWYWMSYGGAGEAYGNLRQRNQFATLMSIGFVAMVCMPQSSASTYRRLFVLLCLALVAAGNAASNSRTGLVQWMAVLVLTGLWSRGQSRSSLKLAVLGVGMYTLFVVGLPWVLEAWRLVPSDGLLGRLRSDGSCGSRAVLWSNVLELIALKPWSGWGWGELDYAHFMNLYGGPRFCEILDNAHNLPLHLAVELGIPFAATVCALGLWLVWRGRPWEEVLPHRQLAWGVIGAILVHSLLEYPLWYGPFQLALALSAWILIRPWSVPKPDSITASMTPEARGATVFLTRGLPRAALAAALLSLLGYVAWRYHQASQVYLPASQRDSGYREDPFGQLKSNWLFRNPVLFAKLTTTPLTRDNAPWTFETAQALLHYSPEPRVIEKLIESAVMLGRDDEALLHLARYRAAFPQEYAQWQRAMAMPAAQSPQ